MDELKPIVKRNIEEIAEAMMYLRVDYKNSKFYTEYEASGKCMYDFAKEWLQRKS